VVTDSALGVIGGISTWGGGEECGWANLAVGGLTVVSSVTFLLAMQLEKALERPDVLRPPDEFLTMNSLPGGHDELSISTEG
jgi:hypothetical protein